MPRINYNSLKCAESTKYVILSIVCGFTLKIQVLRYLCVLLRFFEIPYKTNLFMEWIIKLIFCIWWQKVVILLIFWSKSIFVILLFFLRVFCWSCTSSVWGISKHKSKNMLQFLLWAPLTQNSFNGPIFTMLCIAALI